MPFPILPLVVGGAGVALLYAGSKETKPASVADKGSSATPTQQTTGGAEGGAQAPSHADIVNTTASAEAAGAGGGSAASLGTGVVVGEDQGPPIFTSAPPPATKSVDPSTLDPWAPAPGPSIDQTKISTFDIGAYATDLTTTTGKAAGDIFTELGSTFGSIW